MNSVHVLSITRSCSLQQLHFLDDIHFSQQLLFEVGDVELVVGEPLVIESTCLVVLLFYFLCTGILGIRMPDVVKELAFKCILRGEPQVRIKFKKTL